MSETQERQAPVWHAIVGEGYEPVQIGEIARPDDDVLVAGGWVRAYVDGGLAYREDWAPRRRRKVSFNVWTYRSGYKPASPGDCFMVSEDGDLIPLEPIAEAEEGR